MYRSNMVSRFSGICPSAFLFQILRRAPAAALALCAVSAVWGISSSYDLFLDQTGLTRHTAILSYPSGSFFVREENRNGVHSGFGWGLSAGSISAGAISPDGILRDIDTPLSGGIDAFSKRGETRYRTYRSASAQKGVGIAVNPGVFPAGVFLLLTEERVKSGIFAACSPLAGMDASVCLRVSLPHDSLLGFPELSDAGGEDLAGDSWLLKKPAEYGGGVYHGVGGIGISAEPWHCEFSCGFSAAEGLLPSFFVRGCAGLTGRAGFLTAGLHGLERNTGMEAVR